MSTPKMGSDEVDLDTSLVSQLVAKQFPRWADLPIIEVRCAGTDNPIYRLGHHMVVRLPRLPGTAETVDKEQRW
jgi:aminoglycoside phosphotransferase (APT) family kinase protein